MTLTLTIQFLPARQGDAILLGWDDEDGARHRAIIDMGTRQTGRALAQRLAALPEAERTFELLVVTHVDSDHIGGVLSCLVDPGTRAEGVRFADVWFNGLPHLDGLRVPAPEAAASVEGMGVAQGQEFADWLARHGWNKRFDRGPVARGNDKPVGIDVHGLRLTVLGPTPARLAELRPFWLAVVEDALHDEPLPGELPPGIEGLGSKEPPTIEDRVDLEIIANERFTSDNKVNNGTSITLLAEWGGRRLLLTGDAFAADVVAGLSSLGESGRVKLDLLKLPHHGSSKNVSKELVAAVDCPLWVISSDGTQYRHPDAQAIARILVGAAPAPGTLAFNVPSTYSTWWDNPEWRRIGDYETSYGDAIDGLTITFEPVKPWC